MLYPTQSGYSDGEIAVAGCCFLRDVENSLGLVDFKNKETVCNSVSIIISQEYQSFKSLYM
jgi:hypothetical protein